MATAITYNELQALYLGLFDRPADAVGESYWYNNSTSSSATANALGGFASYYSDNKGGAGVAGAAISSANINGEINNIYSDLLGVTPSSAAVAYWAGQFTAGTSIGSIVDQIFNIVENLPSGSPYIQDKTTMDARMSTATSYTQANANVAYSNSAYLIEGQAIMTPTLTPWTLTTAIDNFAPVGNSLITGVIATSTTSTVNSLDTIKATGSNNTFDIQIQSTAAIAGAVPTINVSGVQTTNIISAVGVSGTGAGNPLDTTSWTGLVALNVTASTGTDIITAASTTAVTVTDSKGNVTIDGGAGVTVSTSDGTITIGSSSALPTGNVTVTDSKIAANTIDIKGGVNVIATETGAVYASAAATNITIGSSSALPTGTVTVNATTGSLNANTIGAIAVTGGTVVNINEYAGDKAATGTNVVMGNVSVTGTTATTAVTVNQAAVATGATASAATAGVVGVSAVSAAPGVNGVTAVSAVTPAAAVSAVVGVSADGTVKIQDSVAPSASSAAAATVKGGTISSVTLSNFGAAYISSPALNTLSLSGTGAAVNLYEGGVNGATDTTLTLDVNNLSGTAITDNSAQFTTLDVIMGASSSTLTSFTDANLATLNVQGSSVLTVTTATSATTVNVSGAAGYAGSISDTTTTFNAAGSTGTDTITIAADATKAITGDGAVNSEVIIAGSNVYTSAKTGTNVTGFHVLGFSASTTQDASVFGSGINLLDVRGTGQTDSITKVNTDAGINFSSAATTTTAFTYHSVDANGSNDAVTVTLQGAAASTLPTGAAQTVTALTLEDANGNGIGTVSFVDNNPAFNYAGDNIATLTDAALTHLNFSGVGGLTIGATAFTNDATAMTIDNTGTNAAGLIITMTDNSLGALSLTGSGTTTLNLTDTVSGTGSILGITNSGTGSVTVNAGTLSVDTVNLTGAQSTTFTDNSVTSLSLAANQTVSFTDSGTSGITVSGAADNGHVTLAFTGTAATNSAVDTINLGNANNSITDAELASKVNINVGSGGNLIVLGAATTDTTGVYNVTLASHTSTATVYDEIKIGTAGTAYATTPNLTVTGAEANDNIVFLGDANAVTVLAAVTAAPTLAGTITSIESAAAAAAHDVAFSVFGGNTYVAENSTTTISATTTTLIELVGTHTLTAGTGLVVIH